MKNVSLNCGNEMKRETYFMFSLTYKKKRRELKGLGNGLE